MRYRHFLQACAWGVALGYVLSVPASDLEFEREVFGPFPLSATSPVVWGYTVNDSGKWSYEIFPMITEEDVTQIIRKRVRQARLPRGAEDLARHILAVSLKFKFDPAFVLAVIEHESSFRPAVVSYAGAVGLMQIMPDTAAYLASRYRIPYRGTRDLRNPYINVLMGVTYLSFLRESFEDHFGRFLAAYNVGPGRIRQLVMQRRFKLRATKPYVEGIRAETIRLRQSALENVGI